MEHGWYAERLEEEQEQLSDITRALKHLDFDTAAYAVNETGDKALADRIRALQDLPQIADVLNELEKKAAFLQERIEHLKPLAAEERVREERRAKSEHEASV